MAESDGWLRLTRYLVTKMCSLNAVYDIASSIVGEVKAMLGLEEVVEEKRESPLRTQWFSHVHTSCLIGRLPI